MNQKLFNLEYVLYGNKNNIKFFNIINNINSKNIMGSYFVIPFNVQDIEEYENNLKKIQYDKNSNYFEINSNFLKYNHLSYFEPNNSYYIDISLELSKFLNTNIVNNYNNFKDIKKIALYMKNESGKFGEYKLQTFFGDECQVKLIGDSTKNEFLFSLFKYYKIYNNSIPNEYKLFIPKDSLNPYQNQTILLWKYNNIDDVMYLWQDELRDISILNGYETQENLCLDMYKYCSTIDLVEIKEQLLEQILELVNTNETKQQFYFFSILNAMHKQNLQNLKLNLTQLKDLSQFYNILIQKNELNKFIDGNIVVFITQEAISELVSNNSNLYIFFENIEMKEYDDFSLSQEKFNTHNEITYSNKYFYLKTPKSVWDTYVEMIESFSIKDNTIYNRLKNLSIFNISSNFPISLIKGTQPNFLYENFKVSPFILEKKIIIFGKRKLNENITIDYGKRFKNFRQKDFELQKGIVPFTFAIFIQDELNKIDYSIFYKSEIYKTKQHKQYQFSLLYDYPIAQFSTNEILELLYTPKSLESKKILMNLYKQEEQFVNKEIQLFNNINHMLNKQIENNNKQFNKNNIKEYLTDIGFDMEQDNYNVYGFIKTYDSSDDTLSNLVCGIIQYTSCSIFMYYKNTNLDKENLILNNYKYMYLDFSYYQFVSNSDLLNHRKFYNIKKNIEVVQCTKNNVKILDSEQYNIIYIDGIKLNENDLVLLVNQQNTNTNGIFKYIDNNLVYQKFDYSTVVINVLNGYTNNGTQWIYKKEFGFYQNINSNLVIQSDEQLKNVIFNDYFKYYEIDNIVYLPFFSKIHGINKIDRYTDMELKLQIYDIPLLYFGQLSSNRIFKDFNSNNITYSKIEGTLPIIIKNFTNIEGYIPICGFYFEDNIKMLKRIAQYIPIELDTKQLFINKKVYIKNLDILNDINISEQSFSQLNINTNILEVNLQYNLKKVKQKKIKIFFEVDING